MRRILEMAITAVLAAVLMGMGLPGKAAAQCGSLGILKESGIQQVLWQTQLGSPSLLLVGNQSGGPIVGLWKVKFISEGNSGIPDGTVIDNGFAEWHSDGTELMNSSKPPATGNFCMGVWQKSGRSDYQLNHFALGYDINGTFIGPVQIQEKIAVNKKAQTYSGTFTIDQFDPAGNSMGHVAGNVTGKRVTIDTTVDQVL